MWHAKLWGAKDESQAWLWGDQRGRGAIAMSPESSDVTYCLRVMPSHVIPCQSVIMTLSDQRLIDKDGNLVETQPGRMEESILGLTWIPDPAFVKHTDRFEMRITKRDCKSVSSMIFVPWDQPLFAGMPQPCYQSKRQARWAVQHQLASRW